MNFEDFESKGFYERKNDVFYIYIKKDKSIVICYYNNSEKRFRFNMEIKKVLLLEYTGVILRRVKIKAN